MNCMQAAAGNYKKGRTGGIKYIVIHYTANNGDTAFGNAKYFHKNKNYMTSTKTKVFGHTIIFNSKK